MFGLRGLINKKYTFCRRFLLVSKGPDYANRTKGPASRTDDDDDDNDYEDDNGGDHEDRLDNDGSDAGNGNDDDHTRRQTGTGSQSGKRLQVRPCTMTCYLGTRRISN